MTSKLTNNLTKCVASKRSFPHSLHYPTGNLSDQLEKRCHKFTHILHFPSNCIYQSYGQENVNDGIKFLQPIGAITEQH